VISSSFLTLLLPSFCLYPLISFLTFIYYGWPWLEGKARIRIGDSSFFLPPSPPSFKRRKERRKRTEIPPSPSSPPSFKRRKKKRERRKVQLIGSSSSSSLPHMHCVTLSRFPPFPFCLLACLVPVRPSFLWPLSLPDFLSLISLFRSRDELEWRGETHKRHHRRRRALPPSLPPSLSLPSPLTIPHHHIHFY